MGRQHRAATLLVLETQPARASLLETRTVRRTASADGGLHDTSDEHDSVGISPGAGVLAVFAHGDVG